MKILSLYDGMACGMLAFQGCGIKVEQYDAYEIDKFAVKTATHNFPMIQEHGDVFGADFTQYEGADFLIGGSPCTYWSIAQTKNRETVASGLGWDLFSQYVRALKEAKPRYFIYENNKSMSKAIRNSIRETFGFEEICINSALVSAQNRQRYYWVGKRNADGSYNKVNVEQPEDQNILLKDILEINFLQYKDLSEKEINYMVGDTKGKYSDRWTYAQKPGQSEKAMCITANMHRGVPYNVCCQPVRVGTFPGSKNPNYDSKQYRIYSTEGKSVTLCGQGGGLGAKTGLYAEPVAPAAGRMVGRRINAEGHRDDYNEDLQIEQRLEINKDPSKTNCISTVTKDNVVCEPLVVQEATKQGYTEIQQGDCVDMTQPNSKTRRGRNMKDKCNCLTTSPSYYQYLGKVIVDADGKEHTVYTVKDGKIKIKDNEYPIKLVDGQYIIRKLTVNECKRLQTVPDRYEFPVSNTQAYKMLGNGWTIEVIKHLINSCLEG